MPFIPRHFTCMDYRHEQECRKKYAASPLPNKFQLEPTHALPSRPPPSCIFKPCFQT